MSAIRGTIRNGKVEFDAPPGWPEGTEVRIDLVDPLPEDDDSPEAIAKRVALMDEYVGVGMREEDWPTDEAGIAALVASIDLLQPFVMTSEEEAEWQNARAEQKAWQLANWEAHCKKIEDLFK